MGEAKRRQKEIAALKSAQQEWLDALPNDERVIADTALRLHQKLVVGKDFIGGCYHLAFFLRRFLLREHGISVQPVVGYVNDGTCDIMISHAWLEYGGKKTDISLTRTEFAESQLTGGLLVLDRVIRKGVADYTYHLQQSPDAEASELELIKSTDLPPFMRFQISQKRQEHGDMLRRAADDALIDEYLAAAPAALNYESLARYART